MTGPQDPFRTDRGRPAEGSELVAAARSGCADAQAQLEQRFDPLLRRYMEARVPHLRHEGDEQPARDLAALGREVCGRARRALEHMPEGAGFEDFRSLLLQHAQWVVRTLDRGRGRSPSPLRHSPDSSSL